MVARIVRGAKVKRILWPVFAGSEPGDARSGFEKLGISMSCCHQIVHFAMALGLASSAFTQAPAFRYALILNDAPVAERFASREAISSAPAAGYRKQLQARHAELHAALRTHKLTPLGSVDTVLNAVFVAATPDRLPELEHLP